ncbi:MAG TPA: hypothetical protein VNO30_02660 [Kofleriaceae bacterium]|nr:hypothetical protein [Kofleriaceae bacterium]
MRKLDLHQISRQLLIGNDNTVLPAAGAPAPLALPPEPAPHPARAAPDPRRGGGHRGAPAARGHAPAVPLPRALRPRRRS